MYKPCEHDLLSGPPFLHHPCVHIMQRDGKLFYMALSAPADIVKHLKAIASSSTIRGSTHPPLATRLILSAIEELVCPLCLSVLQERMHLPCDRLVCASSLIEWVCSATSRCP